MSIIPQEDLKAVNSFELKSYTISSKLDKNSYTIDAYTNYDSFWKAITIRNFSDSESVYYREEPNGVLEVIPPLAERTLNGWGSFINVEAPKDLMLNGIIVLEMVKRVDAING